MHYLYILEGRLKYETISFESEVVFNLYNKNVERRAESVGDDDLVYFLKSDVDTIISVNLTTNKILLSAPFSQTILLFDQAGSVREVIAEREIDLSDDIVKFKIVDIDFSFLINTMTDPDKGRISVSNLQTSTSTGALEKIKIGLLNFVVLNKFSIFIFIVLLVFILVPVISSLRDEGVVGVPSSVVFDNESELMRANLQEFNSDKILVKTHLMRQVQLYFEQQGYRYVKFDLEKQENGNFNLLLFVFPNNIDKSKNFNLVRNQFQWIESVIVNTIDMKDMITDFNNLAKKYSLEMIDKKRTSKAAFYQLVEVSFVNNNLRFESLQRDLNTFYERWGNNYIEFNVSLKKHRELPIDFILKRSDEEVIKSDQGFYIN